MRVAVHHGRLLNLQITDTLGDIAVCIRKKNMEAFLLIQIKVIKIFVLMARTKKQFFINTENLKIQYVFK